MTEGQVLVNSTPYIQQIIIPAFVWLVFLIILLALAALVVRTFLVIKNKEYRNLSDQTLGLPRGTIRSFIVISFTTITFLVFFGDFGEVEIPADDRKWFLTAYGSVLAFYFGTKAFPERASAQGMVISNVSPPVSHLPASGSSPELVTIGGHGFESPKAVSLVRDGQELDISQLDTSIRDKISVVVTLSADSALGSHDVIVDLANGSRIVKTAGYTLENAATS